MTNDTMKEIINDTVHLATVGKDPMMRLALEGIANRLQTLCDAGLYITPKAAVEALNAEKQSGKDAESAAPAEVPAEKRGLVGIIQNERHCLAWNYTDGLDIRVTSDKLDDKTWKVTAFKNGILIFDGCCQGGKWLANVIARFIRNAMTNRAMKLKWQHAKRRATANPPSRCALRRTGEGK